MIFTLILAREILERRVFLYALTPVLVAKTFSLAHFQLWGGPRFAVGILTLLCFLKFLKKNKKIWLFYSGILTTIASFFSIEVGLCLFVSIILTLLLFYGGNIIKQVLIYISGLFLVYLPFLLYLLFKGGFDIYLKTHLFVLNYLNVYQRAKVSPDILHNPFEAMQAMVQPFGNNFQYVLPMFIYPFFFLYLARKILSKKINIKDAAILCIGAYGLSMYLSAFRSMGSPHYEATLPTILVVYFVLSEKIIIFFDKQKQKKSSPSIILFKGIIYFLIILMAFPAFFRVKNYLDYGFDINRVVYRQYTESNPLVKPEIAVLNFERAKNIFAPKPTAEELNSIVSYLTEKTSPQEVVFSFNRTTYNFFIDRPIFSRFCFLEMASYNRQWFDELFFELSRKKPRYIIAWKLFDFFESVIPDSPLVEHRNKIRLFIQQNYHLETSFGQTDIYRANSL
jgi:hypothetical protein